jgi:hypothetical protein
MDANPETCWLAEAFAVSRSATLAECAWPTTTNHSKGSTMKDDTQQDLEYDVQLRARRRAKRREEEREDNHRERRE